MHVDVDMDVDVCGDKEARSVIGGKGGQRAAGSGQRAGSESSVASRTVAVKDDCRVVGETLLVAGLEHPTHVEVSPRHGLRSAGRVSVHSI